MDFTRNDSTDYLWKTLEKAIEKADSLLTKNSVLTLSDTVLPVSELSDIEDYKSKVFTWQQETALSLQSMFKDQAVAAFYCPPIRDIDLIKVFRPEAMAHLKTSLAERVESLKSLISKVRQAEGLSSI
jgi:hypothetical protein